MPPEIEKRIIEEFIRREAEKIPDTVVRGWFEARLRKQIPKVKVSRDKLKIIAEEEAEIERFKRDEERERLLGRKEWEKCKARGIKFIRQCPEALVHWGRVGYLIRYRRGVLERTLDFWRGEYRLEVGKEFIGRDADTGRWIYYDLRNEIYAEVDEKGKIIYESPELQLDETISVETKGGHDAPLTCEVTTRFKVNKMTRDMLRDIERKVQTQLDTFLKSYKDPRLEKTKRPRPFSDIESTFDPLKTGIEYRVRVRPETLFYPKGEVVIERSSELYPAWAKYPKVKVEIRPKKFAFVPGIFQINLPTGEVKRIIPETPKKIIKSVRREEEEELPEVIERKKKEVKEVL